MRQCPECAAPKVTLEEIGWRKLRIVGDSPRGYRFKVLTVQVPTAVMGCGTCTWEEHGYIHNGMFYVDDETVLASTVDREN